MAYIGNTVETQGFTPAIDYFNGNGVTVTFTLSRPVASVAQVIVAIDNVIQNPSSAFTVSGNSITFTSAPLSGSNNIWVEYTSLITQTIAPGQGTIQNSSFAAGASEFAAGTALVFKQTAAPTGWTKVTTDNDAALRVVSGTASTGGTVNFTTAFASQAVSGTVGTSGATTLTASQIPSHTHSYSGTTGTVSADHNHGFSVSGNTNLVTSFPGGASAANGAQTAGATGGTQISFSGSGTTGGQSSNHTHNFSGTTDGGTGGGTSHTHTGGTFTGTAINLAVKYVDVIMATKD